MSITIKKINSAIEKRILTGMIVSKEYLSKVHEFTDISYFKNNFAKKVAVWCLEYFERYQQSPYETIQDIYTSKLPTLSTEESDIISQLLTEISDRYAQTPTINSEYMLDQTIQYFKRRELEIVSNNIRVLLDEDKIEDAEREIKSFKKLSKLPRSWANPFDEQSVNEVFEDKDNGFFKFPGRLGEFIGNFEREWLVAFIGPFKRGKTWWLQEMAIIAVVKGLRVAFFSLEMKRKRMHERIYKRLVAAPAQGGPTLYPTFDCVRNQTGECNLPQRTSAIPLLDASGRKPSRYDPVSAYTPCTSCRGGGPYLLTTWWEMIDRPPFSHNYIYDRVEAMRKRYKHTFRTIAYPRFSANTEDINRDLDSLITEEGFIPDVIIIDYADILKHESSTGVDTVDETWKNLARLGGERKAMIVTASQGTREGTEVETLRQKHTALWIGKLAHVDAIYSLNQTEDEKGKGIMRVGVLAHRHEDFSPSRTCIVLQNLDLGQVHLDSEMPTAEEWEG